MNFGIIGKALAGAGKGMAIVGQAGLNADLLAKRDQVLQNYENQRQASEIASREKIAGEQRQTQREVGLMQKEAHLKGIQMQLDAKDTKPTVLPKGAKLIGADGSVLVTNDTEDDKPITVPEGAAVIGRDGNEIYKNPAAPKGLPQETKDMDQRVQKGLGILAPLFGGSLDAFGRLSLPPDNEKRAAAAMQRMGDLIRGGMNYEQAARQAYEENRKDVSVSEKAPSGGSSRVDEAAKKYGF